MCYHFSVCNSCLKVMSRHFIDNKCQNLSKGHFSFIFKVCLSKKKNYRMIE